MVIFKKISMSQNDKVNLYSFYANDSLPFI